MKRIVYAVLALLTFGALSAPRDAEAAWSTPPPGGSFVFVAETIAAPLEPAALPLMPAPPDRPLQPDPLLEPVFADIAPDETWAPPPDGAVSLAELDTMRGGFSFNGMEVSFGAEVKTFVDGALALQTVFRMTEAGIVEETLFDAGLPRIADALPQLAAAGISVTSLEGLGGVAVIDETGAAAAAYRFATDGVLSTILNTADNQVISQFVDVRIGLEGFDQAMAAADQLGMHLAMDAAHAAIGASGF